MIPTLPEFLQMSSQDVRQWTTGKTIVLSPGGSSRWYFLEHGDVLKGYGETDQFEHYVKQSLKRTFEITDMVMADGFQTVFIIGIMAGQTTRDETYKRNLAKSLEYMVNNVAQVYYENNDIGVMFRGQWADLFRQLDISELAKQCQTLEALTLPNREKWLIWLTYENPVPDKLGPVLYEGLQKQGRLPDNRTLATAYYAGRAIEHIDIYIGHNKPSLKDQIPPLTTMGDTYFTVAPTYYLDHELWRRIVYDHLFERRGIKRDYEAYSNETIDSLRSFVNAQRNRAIGLGTHHAPSQTWRPSFVNLED